MAMPPELLDKLLLFDFNDFVAKQRKSLDTDEPVANLLPKEYTSLYQMLSLAFQWYQDGSVTGKRISNVNAINRPLDDLAPDSTVMTLKEFPSVNLKNVRSRSPVTYRR